MVIDAVISDFQTITPSKLNQVCWDQRMTYDIVSAKEGLVFHVVSFKLFFLATSEVLEIFNLILWYLLFSLMEYMSAIVF